MSDLRPTTIPWLPGYEGQLYNYYWQRGMAQLYMATDDGLRSAAVDHIERILLGLELVAIYDGDMIGEYVVRAEATTAQVIEAEIWQMIYDRDTSLRLGARLQRELTLDGLYAENYEPVTMSDSEIGVFVRALLPIMEKEWAIEGGLLRNRRDYVDEAERRIYWESFALLNAIRQQQDDRESVLDSDRPRRWWPQSIARSSVRRRRV